MAIAEVDKPVIAVTVTAKQMIITPRPQLREEKQRQLNGGTIHWVIYIKANKFGVILKRPHLSLTSWLGNHRAGTAQLGSCLPIVVLSPRSSRVEMHSVVLCATGPQNLVESML